MTSVDVAVVGGGVIGLSIAYELACRGVASAVLDAGPMGRQASWAGAGIIAPGATLPVALPAARLRTLAAALHPGWSARLREETGIDNGYRRCGGVDVALTAAEDGALRGQAGRWRIEGIAFERLEPGDVGRVEPTLTADLSSAYYLPDRAQIRNPRHLRALVAACEGRGVGLLEGRGATGFVVDGGSITAVETTRGPIACGSVVVAAGAWSGPLLGRAGVDLDTRPVRGQLLLLDAGGSSPSRVLEHRLRYLVPRGDGLILVGSTEEDVGFDARTTPEALDALRAEAIRLCPGLAGARVERSWAGLRPGSPDGRPTIGRAPGLANLVVATGHRRSGLQLSTATASLVADLLTDTPTPIDLRAFGVEREPRASGQDVFRS